MSSRQPRLFPYPRPLLERLGAGFFDALPRSPGVYFMRDREGEILYIGQSGNLRSRLFSYKNAQPGSVPRKVIRLVHRVHSIDLEHLLTPEAAVEREAVLLREHRPRFNSAQTWPAAWYYFGLHQSQGVMHLRWTENPEPRDNEKLYGAFRSRMMARHLFRVLTRFTAICRLQPRHPQDLPLLPGRRGTEWAFILKGRANDVADHGMHRLLGCYLAGESSELTDWAEEEVLGEKAPCHSILQELLVEDLETLRDFYERGPRRVALKRRSLGVSESYLKPKTEEDRPWESDGEAPLVEQLWLIG